MAGIPLRGIGWTIGGEEDGEDTPDTMTQDILFDVTAHPSPAGRDRKREVSPLQGYFILD
jgi:hypothetical protein